MDHHAGSLPAVDVLYEEAACGLVLTTADGTIRRANATFCRWTGFAAAELVDRRRIQDLLTVGGRIFHQTHWAPLLQLQGSVAEVKLDVVRSDGQAVPMVLNAVRRQHSSGVFHELALLVAEDRHTYERELVRARRKAEALLLHAEQMMGIVSHDLRNPLSAIKLSTLLLERAALEPRHRLTLARIGRSTDRANRLIEDLLDFTSARIGAGLRVRKAPIPLHAVVAEAVNELRAAFDGRLLVHRAEGEGTCNADADRLSQLLGNLVANAMAYGAADGPVTVTSAVGDRDFSLRVHNLGQPLAPDAIASLFDPMTRGAAVDPGRRSVGLGLYIVREIARAHGGDATVVSTAADGTTFGVTLPRG